MWAKFMDLRIPQFYYDNGNRKKWGVFHYLDWNVNKKISIGMTIVEAKNFQQDIYFDEFDELYYINNLPGVSIETEIISEEIERITAINIFVKELREFSTDFELGSW